MRVLARLDASWRAKAWPGPCLVGQSVEASGGTGSGNAGLTEWVTMPARTDLSFRLSPDAIPLGGSARGRLSFWVRNPLDEAKRQFALDLGNGTVVGSFQEPRSLGLDFTVSF